GGTPPTPSRLPTACRLPAAHPPPAVRRPAVYPPGGRPAGSRPLVAPRPAGSRPPVAPRPAGSRPPVAPRPADLPRDGRPTYHGFCLPYRGRNGRDHGQNPRHDADDPFLGAGMRVWPTAVGRRLYSSSVLTLTVRASLPRLVGPLVDGRP